MLISKTVNVRVTYQTEKYYVDLGYKIPRNNKGKVASRIYMSVKIEDLPLKSNVDIELKCDYCGREFKRRFADHTFITNKKIINKDACSDCASKKFEESFIHEYGVINPFVLDEVKEKIKATNINNLGVENPMYSYEIKEKLKNTNIKKYGVDNPSKSEDVKQKIVNTMQDRFGVDNIMDLKEYRIKIAETLSKNNSVPTSKQQKYLHKLFGGIINYSNQTPILDIAFPDEKIYIEYNGGGHKLSVKLGTNSEENFKNKELRRYHYLKDNGWKAIFIDSDKDLIPNDLKLIDMLNLAKEYLHNGKWIKFDIDKNVLIKDKISEKFNYGKLRKIKNEDIEEVS